MPRKPKPEHNYKGGSYFNRARAQFQVLYEREGSFKRASDRQDLILWPDVKDEKGNPRRPPEHILRQWATEVDDGKAVIPEKIRRNFNKRYDSYTEALVREAVHENAKTSKALAVQVRDGTLDPAKSSQYMHANNATGFLIRELVGKKPIAVEERRVRGLKLLPAEKRQPALPSGTVDGEYRVVS